jgi:hypothetical protein
MINNRKNAMSSGQARSIKLTGDRIRRSFEKQCVKDSGKINKIFLQGLSNQNSDGTYVLKSGNNWQFHLGSFKPFIENWNIEFLNDGKILKYNIPQNRINQDIRSEIFLKSFMLKGDFFVIYDAPNWLIFDSEDLMKLMQDSDFLEWRILESGRIKGDLSVNKMKKTIFTLEYRAEEHKKQFVFGAHGGGAGEKLKNILKQILFFNSIPVDYELWSEFE